MAFLSFSTTFERKMEYFTLKSEMDGTLILYVKLCIVI